LLSPYGCAACGHPFALHSNGTTPCKAVGCHVPDGGPCPGFVTRVLPSRRELVVSLRMLGEAS
jgi:hypothetical protein